VRIPINIYTSWIYISFSRSTVETFVAVTDQKAIFNNSLGSIMENINPGTY